MGRLPSRQDGVDERQYAPVVVARNAPLGMRVHMLLGVVHDKAVTDALKHGDVIVRIAHGSGIGNIDAQVLAQVRDAGALVDAQVHKVDPLAPGVGDVELVRELGAIGLAECGLGIIGGEEDRNLVRLDIKALKAIDVVNRVVETLISSWY